MNAMIAAEWLTPQGGIVMAPKYLLGCLFRLIT